MALMPGSPDLFTRKPYFAVKFCKDNDLRSKRGPTLSRRLRSICNQSKNLHPFGPPFTLAVLLGNNPHFLSEFKAVKIALMTLVEGNAVSENDSCMRHFDTANHVVAPQDKDPSRFAVRGRGRIHNPALEHAIHGEQRHRKQDGRKQYPGPAMPHRESDAVHRCGVHLNRNIPIPDA